MTTLAKVKNSIRKFHCDERGLEAIQVVMILAVAAVALILVKSKWGAIKTFFTENTDKATGKTDGAW